MITIHGGVVSPFVRKTRAFCNEKGIPFDATELSPLPKTPELLAMNPLGKIPILEEEDGSYIPDSSVICQYLERLHPSPALYPEDPRQLARALFLEEWADTKGIETFSPVLFERVIKKRYFQQEPDEDRIASVRAEIVPPAFDFLESVVDEGGCLVAGRISIADCALGAQLQNWAWGGEEIDAKRWPKVHAYAQAVLSRPAFAAIGAALS